jgi:hypothetical protein
MWPPTIGLKGMTRADLYRRGLPRLYTQGRDDVMM